jgi:hypothetical protein
MRVEHQSGSPMTESPGHRSRKLDARYARGSRGRAWRRLREIGGHQGVRRQLVHLAVSSRG